LARWLLPELQPGIGVRSGRWLRYSPRRAGTFSEEDVDWLPPPQVPRARAKPAVASRYAHLLGLLYGEAPGRCKEKLFRSVSAGKRFARIGWGRGCSDIANVHALGMYRRDLRDRAVAASEALRHFNSSFASLYGVHDIFFVTLSKSVMCFTRAIAE